MAVASNRNRLHYNKCTQVTDDVTGGTFQPPLDWDNLPGLHLVEDRYVVNRRQEADEGVIHLLYDLSRGAAVEVAVTDVRCRDMVGAGGQTRR